MASTLLALGDLRFSVDTAAYRNLTRVTEYRWPSQARLGRRPARQFLGIGEDTATLRGAIYPHHRGGLGQLDAMRGEAAKGTPLQLVAGDGRVLGRWVIARVEETQPEHWSDGTPRRQDFVVELAFYGEDEGDEGAGSSPVAAFPSVSSSLGASEALRAAQAPIRDLIGDADIPSAAEVLEGADPAAPAGSSLRELLGLDDLGAAAQALRSVAAVAQAPLQDLVDGGVDLAGAANALTAVETPLRELFDVADIAGAARLVQSQASLPDPLTAAAGLATAAPSLQAAVAPLRDIRTLGGLDPLAVLRRAPLQAPLPRPLGS